MNSQLVSAAKDFYGFMVLLQKFGLALGLFLVVALEWSGFKETIAGQAIPEQPASAECNCVAIGPLPTLCLIFGLIFGLLYPITREVHAEILLKLKQRQTRELS